MIFIFSVTTIIRAIAVTYGCIIALVVALTWMWFEDANLWKSISIAVSGSTVLQLGLLAAVHYLWRRIWSLFPALNTLIFPDLNGRWNITINWNAGKEEGVVTGIAVIKQSLTHFSMEVAAPGSESETYVAVPQRDPASGRPLIYYVYRVVPKQMGRAERSPYNGSAILKVVSDAGDELGGNYFTSNYTRGYFRLSR
jgi:hypothetical protein